VIRLLSKRENLQFSITAFLILSLAILSLFVMQTDIPAILWERTGPLVFPMIFLGSIFFGNVAEAIYLKCFKKELSLADINRVAGAILNAGSLLAHAGFLGTVWGIMLSMSALGENGSVDPPQGPLSPCTRRYDHTCRFWNRPYGEDLCNLRSRGKC